MRSGHTEAAVDLCKLANLPPIGVICELVNDDGTVTRGPQVEAFAAEHGLKLVSVADLIAYRQRKETLVDRVAEFEIETAIGKAKAVSFSVPWDPMHHLALVFGDIRDGQDIPVRLHLEHVASDVFGSERAINRAVQEIGKRGRGVVVYLREGSVGVASQVAGGRESHREVGERDREWREVGLGAQILRELGVSTIALLASRERHYVGLDGFGIEITDTIIL